MSRGCWQGGPVDWPPAVRDTICFVRTVATILLLAGACFAARPVIFDTDMGNDVDDALALAMLHALSDRGECRLIGVTLTNGNPSAVPYVQLVNNFYGRDDLPAGS